MGFIVAVILANAFVEFLMQLFLYHIPAKININVLRRLKRLIVIYKTSILSLNIKALI